MSSWRRDPRVGSPAGVPGTSSQRRDRRARPRRRYDDKVVLWRKDEVGVAERSTAWALNISMDGIRIVLARKLSVGESVAIGLRGRPSTVAGRVVWVSRQLDGCVAGIAFGRN